MRKNKIEKAKRHQRRRMRRELKRRKKEPKRRKRIIAHSEFERKKRSVALKTPIKKEAPSVFSFVDNTNEMLDFLIDCKKTLHNNDNVLCDISNIQTLSSDAIAILAACINEKSFTGCYSGIRGNAPKEETLKRQFIESGFYRFVNSDNPLRNNQNKKKNLFHHESHDKVMPIIAREACQYLSEEINDVTSGLYEMLIESMSNTNNHAAGKKESGKTKWWLYTYNKPSGNVIYTFIDLGVGIFDSIPVDLYKKVKRTLNINSNKDIAIDLLDGKIKSSEKIDTDMRGKGIPQIAANSKKEHFKRAYIISNDVKIDLKSHSAEKLKQNFFGTMLYWEVINKINE